MFGAWKIVGMNKEEKKGQREEESREMVGLVGVGGGGGGFVLNVSLPLSR